MISSAKYLYDILINDPAIIALIGDKLYPVIAPENTPFPCVVYDRSYTNQFTKDNSGPSVTLVNYIVVSETYSNGMEIANAIFESIRSEAKLVGGSELFEDGAFLQILNFEFWDSQT